MKHSNDLQKGEGIRMKKNLSKKQLGAVGLAAMMAVQTPAMAAEVTTSPEATVQETRTAGRSNRTADGRSGDSGSDCRVIT